MRPASSMDDVSEVIFGTETLKNALRSAKGRDFVDCLEKIQQGTLEKIQSLFADGAAVLWGETHITCICEHDPDEDKDRNLSMLRAYGKGNAVALILKADQFLQETDAISCYASPVLYPEEGNVEEYLGKIASRLKE